VFGKYFKIIQVFKLHVYSFSLFLSDKIILYNNKYILLYECIQILLSFNANADEFSFKYKTRIQEIACRQEARVMPNCVLKD